MTSTTFFIIFIPILSIILLFVNLLLAPHNPYQEKDSTFECGFHSFRYQNRTQFSVSFFIFGLLFLLFDLEILLVYPYSVSGYNNDIYGLSIMMIFFILLTLGFIFELGKNALTIDSKQTSVSNNQDTTQSNIFFIFELPSKSSIFGWDFILRLGSLLYFEHIMNSVVFWVLISIASLAFLVRVWPIMLKFVCNKLAEWFVNSSERTQRSIYTIISWFPKLYLTYICLILSLQIVNVLLFLDPIYSLPPEEELRGFFLCICDSIASNYAIASDDSAADDDYLAKGNPYVNEVRHRPTSPVPGVGTYPGYSAGVGFSSAPGVPSGVVSGVPSGVASGVPSGVASGVPSGVPSVVAPGIGFFSAQSEQNSSFTPYVSSSSNVRRLTPQEVNAWNIFVFTENPNPYAKSFMRAISSPITAGEFAMTNSVLSVITANQSANPPGYIPMTKAELAVCPNRMDIYTIADHCAGMGIDLKRDVCNPDPALMAQHNVTQQELVDKIYVVTRNALIFTTKKESAAPHDSRGQTRLQLEVLLYMTKSIKDEYGKCYSHNQITNMDYIMSAAKNNLNELKDWKPQGGR